MKSRSVCWCLLLGGMIALTGGCAESESEAPPVMNAIEMQQAVEAAAEAERMRVASQAPVVSDYSTMDDPDDSWDVPQQGQFEVEFDTAAGKFTIEVNRAWSPVGANRFYELVKDGFYDGCGFFRVVPGFMVQFGLAADPAVTAKWKMEIADDPVVESNRRGYVTFAKTGAPNSRTTQVFINFGDNSRLDADGFSPFGRVTKGMAIVDKISSAHGEQPNQGAITSQGNNYLESNFPKLDYVNTATLIVDDMAVSEADVEETPAVQTDTSAQEDPPEAP
ncbi:MAG: peptidylprolyl isomerase [Fuerstiella sp.]